MITVGVNLLWLVPGVVGGSEEYTLRLLRGLELDDGYDLRVRLYGRPELLDAHPDLAERFDVRLGGRRGGSKLGRIAAEHTWLAAASRHDDVVHHAGGVVPLVGGASVLTIHDLQPLEMPEHFSPAKQRWLATMVPRSARAARLVLVPSGFTAERITALIGISPTKVRVVPHGLEPQPRGVQDSELDQHLRARFGRFLLLPAIAYPHKRHADLVHALQRLRHRFEDLSVVFTGRAGPETPSLKFLAAQLGLADRVHHLGRVEAAELDGLYRAAVAMVFPSSYEGFGNPVLEAMARDCPVITTDAGALPQVAGSAALVVPVGDVEALAVAVARVLDEPALRSELIDAGREQAGRFSAAAASVKLLECYRQSLRLAG